MLISTQKVFEYSPKQLEYIRNAFNDKMEKNHKWNIKIGATRCGKTTLDTIFTIPYRIIERLGLPGLVFFLGVSKTAIERNILEPMREIYGSSVVGEINNNNEVVCFGEVVHCIGTEKKSQVAKLRGVKAKYIYWDEICEANEEVFELVKSRIELEYACVDATGNPKDPNHFIKRFIDNKELDVYCQSWTIYDNPFLSQRFVHELELQYADSVYFDRYILGKWKRAEGAIYRLFCDNPRAYLIDDLPEDFDYGSVRVGIDFGGNKSAHAFVAVGYTRNLDQVIVFDEELIKDALTPIQLENAYVKFANRVYNKIKSAFMTYYDNAEPVLGRGISDSCSLTQTIVKPAWKVSINDRIRATTSLMGAKRLKILPKCKVLIKAFQDAVWDEKSLEDKRVDDGSYCVDILDAFEYCIERDIKYLIS